MSDPTSHSCPTFPSDYEWALLENWLQANLGTERDYEARLTLAVLERHKALSGIEGYPKDRIERAAAALWDADAPDDKLNPFETVPENHKEVWRNMALAAIRAFHGKVADATSPAAPAPLAQHTEGTD